MQQLDTDHYCFGNCNNTHSHSLRLHRRQLPIPFFNQRPLILQLAQLQHLRRQRSQPYPVGLRFTLGTIDRPVVARVVSQFIAPDWYSARIRRMLPYGLARPGPLSANLQRSIQLYGKTIPRWSSRLWWTPPLARRESAPGRSRLRAAIAARSRYSICASAKRTPAGAPHPHHSSRSDAASRMPVRADQPTPAHPRVAKRLPLPAWDFGSARYRRTHPGSLHSRPRRPANPRAAIRFGTPARNFLRAMEFAIAAAPGSTPHAPAATFINNPAGGVAALRY